MKIDYRLVIGALAVYWLFFRKKEEERLISGGIVIPSEGYP